MIWCQLTIRRSGTACVAHVHGSGKTTIIRWRALPLPPPCFILKIPGMTAVLPVWPVLPYSTIETTNYLSFKLIVRLVRKLLQLYSMGTLPLSVRMKWSHGRPDMNFNLCCMLQYYRVVQLVRFQVAFLFCSVLLLKGKWVGHSCKLCWMHTSSVERLSENFEDKAVTYIIFFVGTHWFWKCIFWKSSLGPFWGRQGCRGQTT